MDTDWAEDFQAEGFITDVLTQLKSGKEATVFLCRSGRPYNGPLVAAKVYHRRTDRGFRSRAGYQTGRLFGGSRDDRAVTNKSRYGRAIEEACWVDREFDVLCALHAAGADVPEPVAAHGRTIFMEYLGSEHAPSPRLREITPEPDHAQVLFEQVMSNIACFLSNNIVHADLSPFNILLEGGTAKIIDFPQAVDPRINANAQVFLGRDIANVCRYFERFGVKSDAAARSRELWQCYAAARM